MDKLVKADVNGLELVFKKGQNSSSATFTLTNLMHTMSAAVCLTTSNPSIFSVSQPFSVIPPLSSSSYTLFFLSQSHQPPFPFPTSITNSNTITVRSSMLPIGKPHPDADHLSSLFSKYRPNVFVFHDATIPISFIGPDVVEFLLTLPECDTQLSLLVKKAVFGCTHSQLTGFLTTAISYGKADLVSALVHSAADFNFKDSNLLSVAVQAGNFDVVKALIDVVDSDLNSRNPIHVAAFHGHVEMIRFCVSIGGNPEARDCNGWTPLHCAAAEGHLDAAKCLLECSNVKYVMTNEGKTAFALAVDNGHSHLFHLLHLGDILHRAARVDDVHGLKTCLAAGAIVNDKDQNGWTPLHRAAFKGRFECAKLLLEYGAQVDVVNDDGCTPLRCAVEAGHLELAFLLVSHGAEAFKHLLLPLPFNLELDCSNEMSRAEPQPSFACRSDA